MPIKVSSKLNFKNLFETESITFFIDPKVFKKTILLTFECEKFKQEYKSDMVLYVVNGIVKRCFCKLYFLVLNYDITCSDPQIIPVPIGGDADILETLESVPDFVELHWARNKINLTPLAMDNGFPNLEAMANLSVDENGKVNYDKSNVSAKNTINHDQSKPKRK